MLPPSHPPAVTSAEPPIALMKLDPTTREFTVTGDALPPFGGEIHGRQDPLVAMADTLTRRDLETGGRGDDRAAG